MISHGTGGQFNTVTDNIILISQYIQWILCLQCFQTTLRHRERIVGKAQLLCLRVQLIHREIIDITEAKCIVLRHPQLFTKFVSQLSCVKAGLFLLIGNKKYSIPRLKLCQLTKLTLQLFGDKFINRPFIGKVFRYLQISKTSHTQSCCKRKQLFVKTLTHFRMHLNSPDSSAQKRLKGTFLKEIRQIHDT